MIKIKYLIIIALALAKEAHAQDTNNVSHYKKLQYFNDQSPMFRFNKEQLSNKNGLLRYYALTGYREGVSPINQQFGANFIAQIDTTNGTHCIKMYNLSIEDMFTHGLRKKSYVILEVKDPSRYRYDKKYGKEEDWIRKNGYCYELMMPIGVIKGMEVVDENLEKLFKVKCTIQKRMIKTLVLFRTSNSEKFTASGGTMVQDDETGIYKNVTMGVLGGPWYRNDLSPFRDETGYKGLIDIHLGIKVKSLEDLPVLKKALNQYDLDIKEEMREIEMFVITELK